MPSRPNVLFVLCDQMQAAMMGCMGNGEVRTPHLDALAAEGVLFTNAVANCPVCTPSRAMLQTGKYPLSNRTIVNDLPMPTDQPFLAQVFHDGGYKTGHIGKWHLDGIPREKFTPPGPRRAGYDDFWATYNCHHDYFHPKYYLDTDELVEPEGYEPDIQTSLAIDFMQDCGDTPFFLMLSWGPPHAPYQLVPETYRRLYSPETMDYRDNVVDVDGRQYCDYYAQTTAIDAQLARLVAFLETAGLAKNTIVVFTSDHGDMMHSHGRMKKQQPWEESVHIPLIMRWPDGLPTGRTTDALAGMADLAPTLITMAGLEVPAEMEGMNVLPGALGDGPRHESLPIMDIVPADQALDWDGREWRGVRTPTHTYARYRDAGWVMYNNVADPLQQNNLIDQPEHADLQESLEADLQRWLDRLGDRFLTADDQLKALGQFELWEERQAHFPWAQRRQEERQKQQQ